MISKYSNAPRDKQSASSSQDNIPKDRYKMVCMIMILHGIGLLIPWNMFITATDYFLYYKLGENYTGLVHSLHAENFLQYLGLSFHTPKLIFIWVNVFIELGGGVTTRIAWTLVAEIGVFLCTIILAMVDSSEWPDMLFWMTMLSVIILNSNIQHIFSTNVNAVFFSVMTSIHKSSLFSLVYKLPSEYSKYIMFGMHISGTLTSIFMILSLAFTANIRMAAIYYFIGALFVLLVCLDTYFVLPLIKFYKYYHINCHSVDRDIFIEDVPYKKIFKSSLPQLYNIFFVYFVTLSIYPAIYANVCRYDENFFISEKYFDPVLCFLTFNFFGMLGCFLPKCFTWPKPKYVWIPVTMRILYIPFYWFCNYKIVRHKRNLPVLFNDWVFWGVSATMSFTSGYLGTLSIIYISKTVEETYFSVAIMYAEVALTTGLFLGVCTTFIWPMIITQ